MKNKAKKNSLKLIYINKKWIPYLFAFKLRS
jgi:hypothetical protein